MLIPILAALIPALVTAGIAAFGGSTSPSEETKRAWVTEFVQDFQPLIVKYIPSVSQTVVADIENAVALALNEALDAAEGPDSPDTQVPPTVASNSATPKS